jgi:hypothetical protein
MATLAVAGLLPAPPASAAASTVASWEMDEISGTVMADGSGAGHSGTLRHVQLGIASPSSRAYGFNGTNSVVTVPDAADLDPADQTFRVATTLRLARAPRGSSDFDVVRKGVLRTAGGYWKMQIDGAGRANCRFKGPGGDVRVGDVRSINDGAWHAVACVRSSSSVTVEVDGRSTTRSGSVGAISTRAALSIGSKPAGTTDQFAGSIDWVRITRG